MTDERQTEHPSDPHATVNGNPVAAFRREELKYAYRSRRDTPAIRANRKLFADHIAAIEAEPVPEPAGDRLQIAERYRDKRLDASSLSCPALPAPPTPRRNNEPLFKPPRRR
jgi:hypothetical protein